MNKKPIDNLIRTCLDALEQTNYKREVLDRHRRNLVLLRKFMCQYDLELYSENIGESFKIAFLEGASRPEWAFSEIKSSINLLNDTLNGTPIRRKRVSLKTYPLPGEIGFQIRLFLDDFKRNERPNDKTYYKYESVLSRFAVRMNNDNVTTSNLDHIAVNGFMASAQNIRFHVCRPVRRFLRFLYEQSIISTDLSAPLYLMKPNNVEKLPSVYNVEEIKLMDRAIERVTGKGKRNYAIFLLASRLGLRASDIANLQFRNIDWDRNLIILQQIKTQKTIELPLLTIIGEALIDYIRFGRPKSESKMIFISACAPYNPIGASSVCMTIRDVISKAGLTTRNRHSGAHSLRHSLATQMIEQGESLSLISETLGHSNTQTTMVYLGVDVNGLLSCSLYVPPIPECFYNQEGGVYHA